MACLSIKSPHPTTRTHVIACVSLLQLLGQRLEKTSLYPCTWPSPGAHDWSIFWTETDQFGDDASSPGGKGWGWGGEHGEKCREQDRGGTGLETAEGWLLTPCSIYCSQRCALLLQRLSYRAFQVLLQLTHFPSQPVGPRKHTPLVRPLVSSLTPTFSLFRLLTIQAVDCSAEARPWREW